MSKPIFLLNFLIVFSLLFGLGVTYVVFNNVLGLASSLKVSSPSVRFGEDDVGIFLNVSAVNPGPFAAECSVDVEVGSSGGRILTVTNTVLRVPVGAASTIYPIQVRIDLGDVSEEAFQRLAEHADELSVSLKVNAALNPVIGFSSSVDVEFPWKPPIHNLTLGESTVVLLNQTHFGVQVSFGFSNLSEWLSVDESLNVAVSDGFGELVGAGYADVVAPPKSRFDGALVIAIRYPTNITDLFFNDRLLTYRVRANASAENYDFTLYRFDKTLEIEWGALIRDPEVKSWVVAPLNQTHSRIQATVSLTNTNEFVSLSLPITPFLKHDQSIVATGTQFMLEYPSGATTTFSFNLVTPNSVLLMDDLKLILVVQSLFGEVSLEVPLVG